jgi:hypothetical protein
LTKSFNLYISGILPESLFVDNDKSNNFDILNNDTGIVPVKLLADKSRVAKLSISDILAEILPVRFLDDNFKETIVQSIEQSTPVHLSMQGSGLEISNHFISKGFQVHPFPLDKL